jgi:hypothetical protein
MRIQLFSVGEVSITTTGLSLTSFLVGTTFILTFPSTLNHPIKVSFLTVQKELSPVEGVKLSEGNGMLTSPPTSQKQNKSSKYIGLFDYNFINKERKLLVLPVPMNQPCLR